MRSFLSIARQIQASGQFISRRVISSNSSSSSGAGGRSAGDHQSGSASGSGSDKSHSGNKHWAATGPKKGTTKPAANIAGKSSSPFKKMADAVKEKAGFKGGDSKPTDNRVKHDRSSRRFTLDLGDKKVARVDYKSIGPDRIEMYHSEVPVELRGRGLGKALARGALEQAAKENMKVKLTCSYLIDFVNKSTDPRFKKTLIKE